MRTLWFISLSCAALVFGLTLGHVLQAPGSRSLPGSEWLHVQHTFYGGFAVVGGAAEIIGVGAAAALAASLRHQARAWIAPLAAALCLLGTLAAYGWGNRPVNARVAGWTPATLPPDWASHRDVWEAAHAASALLSGIAFVLLLIGLLTGRPAERTSPRR